MLPVLLVLLAAALACGTPSVAPQVPLVVPPQFATLTVQVGGTGAVRSTPAGIDCPGSCSATFAAGTGVQLTAVSASGWQLSGFSGACSGASCAVILSNDASVTATFTQLPPPSPLDDCAGLMPTSLGMPVTVALRGLCTDGTSDDGIGNFALGTYDSIGHAQGNQFFTIQNGAATQTGDDASGDDSIFVSVQSQPSGFTAFYSGPNGNYWLTSYDHEGTQISKTYLGVNLSALSIDPSGGTAVVRAYANGGSTNSTYQHLDKTGAAETGEVGISKAPLGVWPVGVALSGHALAILPNGGGDGGCQANWLMRDGTTITGWFDTPMSQCDVSMQFLIDGSLAMRAGRVWSFLAPPPSFVFLFQDGQPQACGLPGWLAARADNELYVIRNGKGYASWGSGGQCGGALEVLAASGKSCGCVSVPNLGINGYNRDGSQSVAGIGRDGSLMVGHSASTCTGEFCGSICTWELYPQLLK